MAATMRATGRNSRAKGVNWWRSWLSPMTWAWKSYGCLNKRLNIDDVLRDTMGVLGGVDDIQRVFIGFRCWVCDKPANVA